MVFTVLVADNYLYPLSGFNANMVIRSIPEPGAIT